MITKDIDDVIDQFIEDIDFDVLILYIKELKAENAKLKANQFPSEPICGRCGEPRKLLGVLYETHFHSERITQC